VHERYLTLDSAVRKAREEGAKALRRRDASDDARERHHFAVGRRLLMNLVARFGVDFETERVLRSARRPLRSSAGWSHSAVRFGTTELTVPLDQVMTFRMKLPLRLVRVAESLDGAIVLAALEELESAKSFGRCPYCRDWWVRDDRRHRVTCGHPECDLARQREWHQQHPEARKKVTKRVREWRAAVRKEQAAIRPRKGATHVTARAR